MGCGQSVITPVSKEIDRVLKEAAQKQTRELKILLLGTGGSGKSTIAKQMKILHLDGYSATERGLYTEFVYLNIFAGFKQLVRAMDQLKRVPDDDSLAGIMDELRSMTVHHGNVRMTR